MEKSINKINSIQNRLKDQIQFEIRASPSYLREDGKWCVFLTTENNNYPHWLQWQGDEIPILIDHVLAYLNGKEQQPHGGTIIAPEDWQQGITQRRLF